MSEAFVQSNEDVCFYLFIYFLSLPFFSFFFKMFPSNINNFACRQLQHFLARLCLLLEEIQLVQVSFLTFNHYLNSLFNLNFEHCLIIIMFFVGDAVVNVYINHEKKFAFVEMRSVEEASNAMALDGIIFEVFGVSTSNGCGHVLLFSV